MQHHRVTSTLVVLGLLLLPGVAEARVTAGDEKLPIGPEPWVAPSDPLQDVELGCSGPLQPPDGDPDRDWRTVVVDPLRPLPRGWTPPDLVDVPGVGYAGSSAVSVRRLVVADLRAMHRAARADDAPFVVVSGYRSHRHQGWLYRQETAAASSAEPPGTAPPGHSEHQLGTTIDVVDPGLPELVPGLSSTPAGRWLDAHAADHGFVVSYPEGARDRTCYRAEPWHLRYVGRELAAELVASDLDPREFLLTR